MNDDGGGWAPDTFVSEKEKERREEKNHRKNEGRIDIKVKFDKKISSEIPIPSHDDLVDLVKTIFDPIKEKSNSNKRPLDVTFSAKTSPSGIKLIIDNNNSRKERKRRNQEKDRSRTIGISEKIR